MLRPLDHFKNLHGYYIVVLSAPCACVAVSFRQQLKCITVRKSPDQSFRAPPPLPTKSAFPANLGRPPANDECPTPKNLERPPANFSRPLAAAQHEIIFSNILVRFSV